MAKVFMALPRHGQVEPESQVAAFLTATMRPERVNVVCKLQPSSLLAYGFNQSYCEFLNDPSYDYFGMLHADVYPQQVGWLDLLMNLLDDGQGDIIHAVCAIKDDRGLTSTAIGTIQDKWRVRRLTITELHAMPVSFDVEDVTRALCVGSADQYCLLPNTGCLLMKRGEWCTRFPGFTINDEIVKLNETLYVPRVEPEDWNLGRWAAANKVRVLGTRAVVTQHMGRASYGTHEPWGKWSTDVHGNVG